MSDEGMPEGLPASERASWRIEHPEGMKKQEKKAKPRKGSNT